METVKVLVCGGRKGVLTRHVFRVMDDIAEIVRSATGLEIEVGEGRAKCVDQAAGAWADHKAAAHWKFPINNDLDGFDPLTAPKRRNQRMLDVFKPDVCVGFPGGGGTFDMMQRCESAGVPVWDVALEGGGFAITLWRKRPLNSLLIHKGKFDEPLALPVLRADRIGLHAFG